MTKTPTLWYPDSSGTATDDSGDDSLLLETGDRLLLETGDRLLLEDATITTKEAVVWSET